MQHGEYPLSCLFALASLVWPDFKPNSIKLYQEWWQILTFSSFLTSTTTLMTLPLSGTWGPYDSNSIKRLLYSWNIGVQSIFADVYNILSLFRICRCLLTEIWCWCFKDMRCSSMIFLRPRSLWHDIEWTTQTFFAFFVLYHYFIRLTYCWELLVNFICALSWLLYPISDLCLLLNRDLVSIFVVGY